MSTTFSERFGSLLEQARQSPLGMARGDVVFERTNLYLRIGRRIVGNEFINCLQIAKVVTPKQAQGKGSFKRFLVAARELTPLPFYVELVLNKRFAEGLIRNGFTVVNVDMGGTPDLIRYT